MQLGPSNPLCDLEQYGRTLQKLTEVSGLKNPELYFKDIDPQAMQKMQQGQQKPDPKVQEAQERRSKLSRRKRKPKRSLISSVCNLPTKQQMQEINASDARAS
jgi:hypothetical protein